MTWPSENARAHLRQSGFTLIEMLVVLAVVGFVLALLTFGKPPLSPATEARAAAQSLTGALTAARSEAVMKNRPVVFMLDLANRTYGWKGNAFTPLSPRLRMSAVADAKGMTSDTVARIRFDPDGGSSGGRITIEGGNRSWLVGIDWLSGRVTLHDARNEEGSQS